LLAFCSPRVSERYLYSHHSLEAMVKLPYFSLNHKIRL
jgi:hypothetical protein